MRLLLAVLACSRLGPSGGDGAAGVDSGEDASADADGDGYSVQDGDCDDGNGAVSPAAAEGCNDRDDDCDGQVDEDPVDAPTWYPDLDGDGFAGPDGAVVACQAPGGWGSYVADCDDGDPAVFPGAAEVCNGLDDDCDEGTSEEGLVALDGLAAADLESALAASVEGSEVRVCGGGWVGEYTVEHSLTLLGDAALLEGRLAMLAGTLELSGFTISGGEGEVGGCLDARGADALLLQGVTLDGCTASRCGGLAGPEAGQTRLVDTVLTGHASAGEGGCVCAHDLVLEGSELAACVASRGGGAWVDGAVVADTDSRVRECAALEGGGGAWLEGGTWTGGTIEGNAAGEGGGLYGVQASVAEVVVQANGAQGCGGGLWGQGLSLRSVQVLGNQAGQDGGGACGTDLALDAVEVAGNSADRGGGVFLQGGLLEGAASTFGGEAGENEPDDLAGEGWSVPDAPADFSCGALGCG